MKYPILFAEAAIQRAPVALRLFIAVGRGWMTQHIFWKFSRFGDCSFVFVLNAAILLLLLFNCIVFYCFRFRFFPKKIRLNFRKKVGFVFFFFFREAEVI